MRHPGLAGAPVATNQAVPEKPNLQYSPDSIDNGQEVPVSSVDIRLAIWANGISLIKDHWLTGVGIGNWAVYYPLYRRTVPHSPEMTDIRYDVAQAHNDYVQLIVESGVAGILLIAATAYLLLRQCVRVIKLYDADLSLMGIGALVAIFGILVDAFFSFPFYKASAPPLIGLLFGALLLIERLKSDGTKTDTGLAIPILARKVGIAFFLLFAVSSVVFAYRTILAEQYCRIDSARDLRQRPRSAGALAQYLDRSLQLNDRQIRCLVDIGDRYARIGKVAKAAELYEKALETHPNRALFKWKLAVTQVKLDQLEKAESLLVAVLRDRPGEPWSTHALLGMYLKQGRKDRAQELLSGYIEEHPDDSQMLWNHAILLREVADYRQALGRANHIIELNADYVAEAHSMKGLILYTKSGRKEEGVRHLRRALELKPDMENAKQFRAIIEAYR